MSAMLKPVNNPAAIIERGAMLAAFEAVKQAIAARNSIPNLEYAMVTGDGRAVTVTGTNLDLQISATVAGSIDHGFAATVPGRQFLELLKKAPKADYVGLEFMGEKVAADFEKIRYSLPSLPVADFPETIGADMAGAVEFELPGAEFLAGLHSVSNAVSADEARYYLRGVFMATETTGPESHRLRLVATDGHRLYAQYMTTPDGFPALPEQPHGQRGVIIPAGTVAALMSLMAGKKCPAAVKVATTRAHFVASWESAGVSLVVRSKLVDGTFPDYRRVIPSPDNCLPAKFDRDEFAEAVKGVSLISSERGRAFKLALAYGGRASLNVNNPDAGTATAQIATDWQGAEFKREIEIGFNAAYMLDALAMAGDGEITMGLVAHDAPAVITGSRADWMAVLMPMRV